MDQLLENKEASTMAPAKKEQMTMMTTNKDPAKACLLMD